MKILNIFKMVGGIINHPLNAGHKVSALWRLIKWQVSQMVFRSPKVCPFIDNSKLVIGKGYTGATGNIYFGLHEYKEMGFLLHYLREQDLFVDIGANCGSYTVLAAVVANCKCCSFEPESQSYARLVANVEVNNIGHMVTTYNVALSDKEGVVEITTDMDAANRILTNSETNVTNCMTAQTAILDSINFGSNVTAIKIDVEGFETAVIQGALKTFSAQELNVVIIELRGQGSRYGYDESMLHTKMLKLGFTSHSYDPINHRIEDVTSDQIGSMDVIYIRDMGKVLKRINSSRQFTLSNGYKL